jgi:hypothetical protein
MNFLLNFAALTMAFALSGLSATANELVTRNEIKDTVLNHLLAEEFISLEEMASDFRNNDARTSSGLRKLDLFYFGVRDAADLSFRHFYSDEQSTLDIADAWIDAFPQSPTAALARVIVQRELGWHYRGGGYASSVSQDDYRAFIQHIEIADRFLREAKDYASVDSYYYYLRAHNLKELGAAQEEFLALMHEGLNEFPDAYQLHFAGVDYFAPKWRGSAELIEAYARSAIEFATQTDPDALYARIYWYVSQTQYGLKLFSDSDVVWSDMRRGIDSVLLEFPDQWNIQNFAVFACIANDTELTRVLLDRIQGPILAHELRNSEVMTYCMDVANL